MPLTYTALGDSLSAGVGSAFSSGYVQKYAQILERLYHTSIQLHVHAKPKITTTDFLQFLSNPLVRHDIAASNFITISIGSNDLLQANRAYMKQKDPWILEEAYIHFRQNMHNIIHELIHIHSHTNHSTYIIQVLGLYNPYPQLPHSDPWIQKFNTVLSRFNSHTVRYVDLYAAFAYHGKKVLSFGIHPNGKGYQLMAERLKETL
ncbi:GDSL-type esterase/lipase family protein [Virgibacillus oceani]